MKLYYLSQKDTNNKKDDYKLEFSDFEVVCPNSDFTSEKYICVSYAWENITKKHPFSNETNISNRTLSVLQTACYSFKQLLNSNEKDIVETNKIWVDSLCIPLNNKEDKELHYFLMGEIYSKSMAVFVVLSTETEVVLNKVRNGNNFTGVDFEILNQDKWVSRHWTYQEIVNSGKIYICSENSREKPIFASVFFDKIANEIQNFSKINGLSTLDFQEKLPYLTSLEAVILDWRIMDYQERSIYQVMVNMEYRKSDYSSSKLKAMFGCISNQLQSINFNSKDDYSIFLEICKLKEDYSFIFNTSKNRKLNNEKWCPISYDFKPIFSWLYCYGEGQKGKYINGYLELDNIIIEKISNLNEEPLKKEEMIDYLKKLKFEGSYLSFETESGYFFNQFEIDLIDSEYLIGISTGIKWTFGAPAILIKKSPQPEIYDFISCGVFFGTQNKGVKHYKIIIN
jgi:hypothetical protein